MQLRVVASVGQWDDWQVFDRLAELAEREVEVVEVERDACVHEVWVRHTEVDLGHQPWLTGPVPEQDKRWVWRGSVGAGSNTVAGRCHNGGMDQRRAAKEATRRVREADDVGPTTSRDLVAAAIGELPRLNRALEPDATAQGPATTVTDSPQNVHG